MSVDVLTYCGNIYAECLKNKNGNSLPHHHTMIITDILIPIISLLSLLGVSAWVSYDASLRLRGHKKEDVELSFLYIFPIANFVIDFFCAFLFYIRRQDIFHHHHRPVLMQVTSDYDFSANVSESSSDSSGHEIELSDMHSSTSSRLERTNLVKSSSRSPSFNSRGSQSDGEGEDHSSDSLPNHDHHHHPHHETNVNMMSAFTHVSGDTLRTIATFAAAGVSSFFHIDPSICDAWAAIIVSATIVISALPLVYSISRAINATVYSRLAAAAPVVEDDHLNNLHKMQGADSEAAVTDVEIESGVGLGEGEEREKLTQI
jgi:Co/Zn/Cd efflux system component